MPVILHKLFCNRNELNYVSTCSCSNSCSSWILNSVGVEYKMDEFLSVSVNYYLAND